MNDVIKFNGLGSEISYGCVRSIVISVNNICYLCNLIYLGNNKDQLFGWDIFEITEKSNALFYIPNEDKRELVLNYVRKYTKDVKYE